VAFDAPGLAFALPTATVFGAGPKIPPPDNVQIQAGSQRTFKNWISPDDPVFQWLVLAAQATYGAKSDGTHLELALGGQFSLNGKPSDSKYSVQAQIQVALVDVFDPLAFHFASPLGFSS
jgi:hypothetical protein